MARRRTDLVKAGAPDPGPSGSTGGRHAAPGVRDTPDPADPPATAETAVLPAVPEEPEARTERLPAVAERGGSLLPPARGGVPETVPDERPEDVLAVPPDSRDIGAELAAPPRRKLPWSTLLLAGAVVAALAFTGGVLVEKGQSSSAGGRAGGFAAAARGGTGTGTGAAGGRTFGGAGGAAGGAASGVTFGTVKLVDGSTIYVTDAQGNTVKVDTGKSTTVSESKNGNVSDLQPGQTITVRGSQDSSGDITASTVTEGGTAGGAGGFGGFGGGFGGAGGGRSTGTGTGFAGAGSGG